MSETLRRVGMLENLGARLLEPSISGPTKPTLAKARRKTTRSMILRQQPLFLFWLFLILHMEIGHHSKAPVLDLYNGSRAPAPPKSGSNDLFSLNIIENSQGPQDRARTKVPFVPPLFFWRLLSSHAGSHCRSAKEFRAFRKKQSLNLCESFCSIRMVKSKNYSRITLKTAMCIMQLRQVTAGCNGSSCAQSEI